MISYSINGNSIYEGRGLEKNGNLYEWFYTERGEKQILEHFDTEKKAVQFALKEIKADSHANRNLIAMIKEKQELEKLISELKNREIKYWTDYIPYGGNNDWRTRVFVVGCGIKKATDLIQSEYKTAYNNV